MASHGREVLRARVLHRRKGAGTWKRRTLVAYCGQSPAPCAGLEVLGDYEDTSKRADQKPKDTIELDGAKIEATNGGSPSGSQGSSPYSTIGSSPSPRNSLVGSPSSKNSTLGTSPSSQGISATQYIFQVLCSGKSHEFRTDSENDRIRWVKLLGLLVMFPFAPIPKEPESNPIAESFHCKLDAKKFGAVSAWAVYILPEDVGTTCQIIGLNVLVLKGGRGNKSVGRLEICNPVDPRNPTVSWDRDKMRRTGKTGNLVFIEIGRRCKGGPGLVWMYAGFGEAQALRETLHNFLFQGDGKAVPVMTSAVPLYDNPRASFDSSLPASYKRRGSSTPDSSNPYQHVPRDPDSGYPASPASFSGLDGPPVRLDKHPSFRKQRSAPCDIHNGRRSQRRSNTQSISSSMSERDSTAESFSEDLIFDQEDSLPTPTRSPSPPEHPVDEGCFMGSMDQDDFAAEGPPKRSYTEPAVGAEKPKSVNRCHSTATCQAASRRIHEYEVMVHPKVADMYNKDGYTYMNPAELKAPAQPPPQPTVTRSAPIPVSHQNGEVASGYLLPSSGSSPSSTSPRKYANYDRLPTIAEREARERQREAEETQKDKSSPYENHPLPPSVQNSAPVYYTPNYQNVSLAHSDRRGSQNREEYENVTRSGEQISGSPTGGSRLQKNGSIRRSRAVKEDVRLPLKGNGLSINGTEVKSPSPPQKTGLQYIEVEHSCESEGHHTNPTVREVKYSAIDMVSTNGFHSLQRERSKESFRARTSVV